MSIAVCVTLKNEEADAQALVDSLCAQTLPPDEIVIVDGGSHDGTHTILKRALGKLPVATLIEAPGSNIAAGRNTAIAQCIADRIAITDAGLVRSVRWLAGLSEALDANPSAAGAYGYVLAAPETTFEAALGAVVLPSVDEIDPATYPPSSGSLLVRRSWIERAGCYPVWLDHGEDLWLDRRIWELGGWFAHAPMANVRIRPRPSMGRFFRQYFNYARGDGQARMLLGRHAVRLCSYLFLIVLLRRPSLWALVGMSILGTTYLRRPLSRLPGMLAQVPSPRPLGALLLVPLIRALGDIAKMAGFFGGLVRRKQP